MKKEDRAGLYITVIVHLTVIIVLLISQIGFALQGENSFVLDFSKQEKIEELKKELDFKEDVSRRIDELIADGGNVPAVRNVAVNRSALKDDRGTDADQLYKDAERLQQDLMNGQGLPDEPDDDYVSTPSKKEDKKQDERKSEYSGPSVVSYQLEGRKASRLPIPAYRCMGAGEVTVIIKVDNAGNVVYAKVQDDVSSTDSCLRQFAVRAARSAKFSSSPTAPANQLGNIVYAFVAQ